MPTVKRAGGSRFFFFSNERGEPPHIHVEAAEKYAKLWLKPVRLARSVNFTGPELTRLIRTVSEEADFFREKWDEFFSR